MGHFTECTGLGVRVEALRYQEGGGTSSTASGPVDYGDVTLRYGLTSSTELWTVHDRGGGHVERRNVSV